MSFSDRASLKFWLGVLFLLFQAGLIVHARFHESRYLCWAPFDAHSEYEISVEMAGRTLTPKETRNRYRMPDSGLDSRSIQHVKNIIKQYEQTYGRTDNARVALVYTTNGKIQPTWYWPAL